MIRNSNSKKENKKKLDSIHQCPKFQTLKNSNASFYNKEKLKIEFNEYESLDSIAFFFLITHKIVFFFSKIYLVPIKFKRY